MSKTRFLAIDTDMGMDDAIALHLLLRPKCSLNVVAVTTVAGNVSVEQATINAAVLLRHSKRQDIPVYPGCGLPLLGKRFVPIFSGHGKDGLGDSGLSVLCDQCAPPQDMHAANALIELARKRPGELEILALGPLTNIALAVSLDPLFASNLKSLTLMGGCEHARGNAALAGEFNFVADPESAYIVLDAFTRDKLLSSSDDGWSPKVTMVPWECCLNHKFPWSFFDTLTPPASATPSAHLLKRVCKAYEEFRRPLNGGFCPCDVYAAAVLDRPELILASAQLFATVEVGGTVARGMVAFDWNRGPPPNVRIIQQISPEGLCGLMAETFVQVGTQAVSWPVSQQGHLQGLEGENSVNRTQEG